MPENYGFAQAPMEWVGPVRRGLAVEAVDEVLASGRLSLAELDRLALSRKTLAHRRTLGRLTAEQSDRLARVLRIVKEAEDTFGDAQKAHAWLRRPSRLLDNESPLDRLDTDMGAHQVEALLGRISHGVAA
jgi:putative toxin-antitoxin system antitoxin component (TIGR02293 family)